MQHFAFDCHLPVAKANRNYCIAGNFHWCKIWCKCLKTPQKKFLWFIFFAEQMCEALTTTLPVDGHAQHANRRNNTEQSEEASLCENGLVFLLCGGLRNYESIKTVTLGEKLAC